MTIYIKNSSNFNDFLEFFRKKSIFLKFLFFHFSYIFSTFFDGMSHIWAQIDVLHQNFPIFMIFCYFSENWIQRIFIPYLMALRIWLLLQKCSADNFTWNWMHQKQNYTLPVWNVSLMCQNCKKMLHSDFHIFRVITLTLWRHKTILKVLFSQKTGRWTFL